MMPPWIVGRSIDRGLAGRTIGERGIAKKASAEWI
jgi:hypothetical protein